MKTTIDKIINVIQGHQKGLARAFLQRHGVVLGQARLGVRTDYTEVTIGGRHFIMSGICGQDDLPVSVVYEI